MHTLIKSLATLGLVTGLALGTATASAAVFTQSTTGLASPTVTQDFDTPSLTVDQAVTSQYQASGLANTANLYWGTGIYDGEFGNISGGYLADFTDDGCCAANGSLYFTHAIDSVGFTLITNSAGNDTTLTALLNGVVVESDVVNSSPRGNNDFYGFTGITFDQVEITAPYDGAFLVDNLQIGSTVSSVPEPSSVALFGLGLLGVAASRRQRRNG